MESPTCPTCGTPLLHDTWEDIYTCRPCYVFFYPEEVGRVTDPDAPIFHLGDDRAPRETPA
jgi:hypothetical protein